MRSTRTVLNTLAALALSGCGIVANDQSNDAAKAVTVTDPFSARPDFFPLGVYLQSAQRAEQWSKIGINLISQANGYLTLDDIKRIEALGMVVGGNAADLVPLDASGATLPFFVTADEPDNAQLQADGTYGPCVTPVALREESESLRKLSGGRPILRNFGRGIVEPDWVGRGKCAGSRDDYYPDAIASVDIVSFDFYPVMGNDRLEKVADGARQLRSYIQKAGGKQAQWGIIEVSAVKGGAAPTPSQIRSMAWMHIINGARGLIFFPWQVGEKGERIREDAVFLNPDAVEGLKALTTEISGLSSAIKSPEDVSFAVKSAEKYSAMARLYKGDAYVFVVNESAKGAKIEVELPDFPAASVDIVGTGSSAYRDGSKFTDDLNAYDARIYRARRAASK